MTYCTSAGVIALVIRVMLVTALVLATACKRDSATNKPAPSPAQPARASECSPDGWCTDVSVPNDQAFTDLWGLSANDIWLTGDKGLLFHYDGKSWSRINTGHDRPFDSVRASAPDDVWIWTGGMFIHGDGKTWSRHDMPKDAKGSGTFLPLSKTELWAADGGEIYLWNGEKWTAAQWPDGEMQSWIRAFVRGPGGEVWAFQDQKASLRWNGKKWSVDHTLGNVPMTVSAWSNGKDDAWAVGGMHRVVHWDGKEWSNVDLPESAGEPRAIWASGPSDAWIVGDDGVHRWDGKAWSTTNIVVGTAPRTRAIERPSVIWGSSADDMWIIAGHDLLRRRKT